VFLLYKPVSMYAGAGFFLGRDAYIEQQRRQYEQQ